MKLFDGSLSIQVYSCSAAVLSSLHCWILGFKPTVLLSVIPYWYTNCGIAIWSSRASVQCQSVLSSHFLSIKMTFSLCWHNSCHSPSSQKGLNSSCFKSHTSSSMSQLFLISFCASTFPAVHVSKKNADQCHCQTLSSAALMEVIYKFAWCQLSFQIKNYNCHKSKQIRIMHLHYLHKCTLMKTIPPPDCTYWASHWFF